MTNETLNNTDGLLFKQSLLSLTSVSKKLLGCETQFLSSRKQLFREVARTQSEIKFPIAGIYIDRVSENVQSYNHSLFINGWGMNPQETTETKYNLMPTELTLGFIMVTDSNLDVVNFIIKWFLNKLNWSFNIKDNSSKESILEVKVTPLSEMQFPEDELDEGVKFYVESMLTMQTYIDSKDDRSPIINSINIDDLKNNQSFSIK